MEPPLFFGAWDEGIRDIPAGRSLGEPEILYPRLEPELVQAEIDRLQALVDDQEA
jgi:hypothetical protein